MRPLIINANSELSVRIIPSREKCVNLTVDGQMPYELVSKENFYNALRFKLNWSGGPHA